MFLSALKCIKNWFNKWWLHFHHHHFSGEGHCSSHWDVLHPKRPPDAHHESQTHWSQGLLQETDRWAVLQHQNVKQRKCLRYFRVNTQSNRADLGPVIEKSWFKTRGLRELVLYAFQNKMIYPRSAVLLEASSLDFSFKDPTSGKRPYILTPSFLPLTMRKGREIHEQKQPNAVIEDKIIFLFYLSAFFLMRWCR